MAMRDHSDEVMTDSFFEGDTNEPEFLKWDLKSPNAKVSLPEKKDEKESKLSNRARFLHSQLIYTILEDAIIENYRNNGWSSVSKALSRAEVSFYQIFAAKVLSEGDLGDSLKLPSAIAQSIVKEIFNRLDAMEETLFSQNGKALEQVVPEAPQSLVSQVPVKKELLKEYNLLSTLVTTLIRNLPKEETNKWGPHADYYARIVDNLKLKIRVQYLEACRLVYDRPTLNMLRSITKELEKERQDLMRRKEGLLRQLQPYFDAGEEFHNLMEQNRRIQMETKKAREDIARVLHVTR